MSSLKIGARELSESEAKLILPTYNEVFSQIEDMRNYIIEDNMQKTNNIGIMGCRGAGKTSLLKTIIKKIENANANDVLLPIIIPENMSTSSTLMATILGLFKEVVDKIDDNKKVKSKENRCICNGEANLLNRKYKEVIKQYTYIQKEYRDILINEFTTESEYVKKSNEIFNSDIEFIRKFNEFLEELIKKQKEEKDKKNPLIFIFIDDIDLSTNRCSDVIKTLLSYISHPSIVTFISGDLDTFEEALTIDFLRKENALTRFVWNETFVGNTKLIDSKKKLAYEYLKKVVPPIYRHNIKQWSLEERGDYRIEGKEGDSFSLSELLIKILKKHRALFKFKDYSDKPDGEEKNIIHTYHLFDDTSRGINNVYNVLLLIHNKMDKNGEINFSDKKTLVETIIASKETYNKNRSMLLDKIINFGVNEETTLIRFDNLKAIYDDKENKIATIERFQLFVLADFAHRLLKNYNNNKITDVNYGELKISMTNMLINNPQISGVSYSVKHQFYVMKIDQNKDMHLQVIEGFLIKLDWEFILVFYRNVTRNSYEIFGEYYGKSTKLQKINAFEKYLYKLYLSLKSCASESNKELKEYIADIYGDFASEFSYIQNSLSSEEERKTIEVIYRDLLEENEEKYENNENIVIYNLLYMVLKDEIFMENKKIRNIDYNERIETITDEDEKNRFLLIYNINKNDLWNHTMSDGVKDYIKNYLIENWVKYYKNKLYENCISVKSFKNGIYGTFKEIYKGSSYTKSKKLTDLIEENLNNINEINFQDWDYIRDEIRDLANNNRVLYGQYEAQLMLNEWNKLYPSYRKYDKSIIYLHCYALFTIKEKDMDSIYLQNAELSEFMKIISESQGKANSDMIENFLSLLKQSSDEEIGIEEFNKLFR